MFFFVWLANHSKVRHHFFYTIPKENKTGANHVIEVIHRFVNYCKKAVILFLIRFTQLNRFTREDKYSYEFAYIKCSIGKDNIPKIWVDVLPIEHTHEDVDDAFRRVSRQLQRNGAVDLNEYLSTLCKML